MEGTVTSRRGPILVVCACLITIGCAGAARHDAGSSTVTEIRTMAAASAAGANGEAAQTPEKIDAEVARINASIVADHQVKLAACCANAAKIARRRKIICHKGADCTEKWKRGLMWVDHNPRWKILPQTADLIETAGPLQESDTAFVVQREKRSRRRYEITFTGTCAGPIPGLCFPDPTIAQGRFTGYVLRLGKHPERFLHADPDELRP